MAAKTKVGPIPLTGVSARRMIGETNARYGMKQQNLSPSLLRRLKWGKIIYWQKYNLF